MDGSANTAIAGLSMGGGEALVIGAQYPETFGYVGSFAGVIIGKGFSDSHLQWKAPRKLLWIACGDADPLAGKFNAGLKQWLQQQKVQAIFVTASGGHQWPVFRDKFANFIPLLFR